MTRQWGCKGSANSIYLTSNVLNDDISCITSNVTQMPSRRFDTVLYDIIDPPANIVDPDNTHQETQYCLLLG